MSSWQVAAWIAAGLAAVAAVALIVRRYRPLEQPQGAYPRLGKTTVWLTAILVGAAVGWIVFLIVSRLGG